MGNENHESGMKGVIWDAHNALWVVKMRRDLVLLHLGAFKEPLLELAKQCRAEAENTATEDMAALKEKYARLKHVWQPEAAPAAEEVHMPVSEAAPVEKRRSIHRSQLREPNPTGAQLNALLMEAMAADEAYATAGRASERAATAASNAEKHAIAAWNNYAVALAQVGNSLDSAFGQSRLGQLVEQD